MDAKSLDEARKDLAPGDFRELGRVDDHIVGVFRTAADTWIWERHPRGDELLHLLEGEIEMTLLQEGGEEVVVLRAGSVCVVPRGVWHRPYARTDVTVFFATPEHTETSQAEDPRTDPSLQTSRI